MTPTTSKLGADMTDGPIATTSVPLLHYQDLVRKAGELRALLARQPAAIGNEADDDIEEARAILENMVRSIELDGNYSTEATCTFLRQALNCLPVAAPLAKEASKPAVRNCQTGWADFCLMAKHDGVTCPRESCDIDDGIRAAPSVEQDERGAQRKVIEPLKEPVSIKKALLGGMTAQVSSSQAVGQPASHAVFLVNIQLTGWSSDKVRAEGFADGFNKAAEWMQSAMSARAASTSANVAQGAEAVALTEDQRQILEWCKNYHFRRCTEGDFHLRIVAVVNQILATPPAQTALTDDARDSERLDWLLHNMSAKEMRRIGIETSGGGPLWGRVAIDAALTAAQSASGDTK